MPKIWGNTPLAHASALAGLLLLCGCGSEREPDRLRAVVAHFAPRCAANASLAVHLEALGDFDASAVTSQSAPGDADRMSLPFPASTRAVSARAEGGGGWLGFGETNDAGGIHLMLWPRSEACTLWPATDEPAYPVEASGVALGFAPALATLLMAGSLVPTSEAARAVSIDLSKGSAEEVLDGMPALRAHATIAPFGDHALLVAGGIDPTLGSGDPEAGAPSSTAYVYDGRTRRFHGNQPIELVQPRARHAAVVLSNGDTILVGGTGPDGVALPTLEAVSPTTHSSRAAGLATLGRARVSPVAFRLDDDRIFVGGGSDSGGVVHRLEWLSPDARTIVLYYDEDTVTLAPHYAFAGLLGGSVLGVGACKKAPCSARRVLWLPSDGSSPRELPDLNFVPREGVDSLALVGGTDGSPWLFARVRGKPVWRRFDPWTGLFDEPDVVPSTGPNRDLPGPLSAGPGVLAWIERADASARLVGFRYDTRSAWARDLGPLILAGRDHVAPSRPAKGLDATGIEYAPGVLGLEGPGSFVQVADATYAGLDAEIEARSGAPPVVLLGSARMGDGDCPWPESGDAVEGEIFTVSRSGTTAVLGRAGKTSACTTSPGRLTVGLAAGASATFIRSLTIGRH